MHFIDVSRDSDQITPLIRRAVAAVKTRDAAVLDAPGYYREWTTSELTAALRPHGAAPYKTNGTMHVGLDWVRDAITERDREGANDTENGTADA